MAESFDSRKDKQKKKLPPPPLAQGLDPPLYMFSSGHDVFKLSGESFIAFKIWF